MGLPLKLTNRSCCTQTHDEDALKFQKQRVGLKSAMLTDVRPIHDGRVSYSVKTLHPSMHSLRLVTS